MQPGAVDGHSGLAVWQNVPGAACTAACGVTLFLLHNGLIGLQVSLQFQHVSGPDVGQLILLFYNS